MSPISLHSGTAYQFPFIDDIEKRDYDFTYKDWVSDDPYARYSNNSSTQTPLANSNNVHGIRKNITGISLHTPLPLVDTVTLPPLFTIAQTITPKTPLVIEHNLRTGVDRSVSETLYIPFPGEDEEKGDECVVMDGNSNKSCYGIINDYSCMKPRGKKERKPRTLVVLKNCVKCGSTETPEWRSGPKGIAT